MSDSVWPHRRQPIRLPLPWDSPGKNTGVGCHFLLQCMKVKSETEVAQLCPTLSDPMDGLQPTRLVCPWDFPGKQRYYFANTGPSSQSYGFSSSHVWMWEMDHKEGLVPKNWCFQIVMLEKTLESILDSMEIKLVNPKGNQLWILTGWTEAEASILWLPDVKNWLIGKDPDAGKGWNKRRRGQRMDG